MRLRVRYGFACCAVLLGLLVSCETSVDEEFKNHFIKYYGGDGNQEAQDFVVNGDGTIMILGTSTQVDLSKKIYVAKVSAEGEVIWKRTWGGAMNEVARDLEPIKAGTYQGGFLLLSNVSRDESDSTNVKILRFDSDGNKIDSVAYDVLSSQFGYSITALSDGGFVFTGNTTDITYVDESGEVNGGLPDGVTDKEDPLAIRYTQELVQQDIFITTGGEELVMVVKMIERNDKFYAVGSSNSSKAYPLEFTQMNFVFNQTTSSGFVQKEFFAGGKRLNESMSAFANSGNIFMAVGTQLVQVNQNRIYVKVIDRPFEAVNTVDDISFEGENIGPSNAEAASVCAALEPNTFWVVGSEVQGGGRNIWVSKVGYDFGADAVDEQISMSFGGSNNDDTGSAIAVLENGDILILGTMELVNQKKIALIKVKANGQF